MRTISLVFLLLLPIFISAQERFITTSDSVQLFVNMKGTGPACLYIHGGPGSGSNWMEEFMGDALEQRFTMIYLDQRGVGRSSSPADHNYSPERMATDFEEIRKELGINQWIILGHSFGGILQMAYVTQHPEAVSGLIFINCTLDMNDSFGGSWLPKAKELLGDNVPEICKDNTVSVYRQMLAIMPVLGETGEMWKIFFHNVEDSRKLNETYGKFESWNTDQSEEILDLDEYWSDFRIYCKKINQPVLFYYGETDWAIGPEHYRGADFPNMILHASRAGHMPFLETKTDLVNAIDEYIDTYTF